MKLNYILFVIVLFHLITGCSSNSKKEYKSITKNENYQIDSSYNIEPFIKHTIYVYNEDCNKPRIIDYSYTPPQKHSLNEITIQIKDNMAIVKTDIKMYHRILSVNYYGFGDILTPTKLAILNTDKGIIRISETKDMLGKSNYNCNIRYGNFEAATMMHILYCKLPEENFSDYKY